MPKTQVFVDEVTGKMTVVQGEKSRVFDAPRAKGGDGAALEVPQDASYTSAFLMERRKAQPDILLPIVLEMEDGGKYECGLKLISDRDFREIGVLMAARGFTLTDMTTLGAEDALFSAVMLVGVTEVDNVYKRRYKSMEDAQSLLEAPGMGEVASTIRLALMEFNPFLRKNLPAPAAEVILNGSLAAGATKHQGNL